MTQNKTLRWGICSAGKISNDFANCLRIDENARVKEQKPVLNQLCSVVSKSGEQAKAFAERFGISDWFNDYEEMAKSSLIDIVYIGACNYDHVRLTELFLNHGKHVVCEKPFTFRLDQIDRVFQLAKSKNLFLMENRWSCFFPIYAYLKEAIQIIGPIKSIEAYFEIDAKNAERVIDPAFESGGLGDIGIYLLNLCFWLIPTSELSSWQFQPKMSDLGVDLSSVISLSFKNSAKASLHYSLESAARNDCIIEGDRGTIRLPENLWAPTRVEVNGTMHEYPLPEVSTGISMNFPNSQGFVYVIRAVHECICEQNLLESPICSLTSTKDLANIMVEFLKSVNSKSLSNSKN